MVESDAGRMFASDGDEIEDDCTQWTRLIKFLPRHVAIVYKSISHVSLTTSIDAC